MTATLRLGLSTKDWHKRDWKGELGTVIICLLLSVWIHFLGFTVWQMFSGDELETFNFVLEDTAPPLELTLKINVPTETRAGGNDGQITAAPARASADDAMAAALAAALAAADLADDDAPSSPTEMSEEMAQTELLSAIQEAANQPVNPDPPMSMEAEAPAKKSYDTVVRSEINRYLILPPAVAKLTRPVRVIVDFTVERDGSLISLVVVESSGHTALDHSALEAIRSAQLPPFPEELKARKQLVIRMNFELEPKVKKVK